MLEYCLTENLEDQWDVMRTDSAVMTPDQFDHLKYHIYYQLITLLLRAILARKRNPKPSSGDLKPLVKVEVSTSPKL